MLFCSARASEEALSEPEGAAKDASGARTSLGAKVSAPKALTESPPLSPPD